MLMRVSPGKVSGTRITTDTIVMRIGGARVHMMVGIISPLLLGTVPSN
jgi:glucose-6-phosphate dehydrogenase assembly protein OpcA